MTARDGSRFREPLTRGRGMDRVELPAVCVEVLQRVRDVMLVRVVTLSPYVDADDVEPGARVADGRSSRTREQIEETRFHRFPVRAARSRFSRRSASRV